MVGRRPRAIVRGGASVYAFLDSCPHKGGYFSEGMINLAHNEVICPRHRFRFRLESGASVTNPEMIVPTSQVRIVDGELIVEFPSVAVATQASGGVGNE